MALSSPSNMIEQLEFYLLQVYQNLVQTDLKIVEGNFLFENAYWKSSRDLPAGNTILIILLIPAFAECCWMKEECRYITALRQLIPARRKKQTQSQTTSRIRFVKLYLHRVWLWCNQIIFEPKTRCASCLKVKLVEQHESTRKVHQKYQRGEWEELSEKRRNSRDRGNKTIFIWIQGG